MENRLKAIIPVLTEKQTIKILNEQNGEFCNIIKKEEYIIYKDYLINNTDNIIDLQTCLANLTLETFTYSENTIYYAKFKLRAKIKIEHY